MEEAIVDEKNKNNNQCGWLLLTPASLQKFRTPKWALFWLSCAAAVQGIEKSIIFNYKLQEKKKKNCWFIVLKSTRK